MRVGTAIVVLVFGGLMIRQRQVGKAREEAKKCDFPLAGYDDWFDDQWVLRREVSQALLEQMEALVAVSGPWTVTSLLEAVFQQNAADCSFTALRHRYNQLGGIYPDMLGQFEDLAQQALSG